MDNRDFLAFALEPDSNPNPILPHLNVTSVSI